MLAVEKRICYTTLVRSLIEYSTMLWSIRRYPETTKYNTGRCDFDYKERLLLFDLIPLIIIEKFWI